MSRARALTEKLALTILARDGIAAIWPSVWRPPPRTGTGERDVKCGRGQYPRCQRWPRSIHSEAALSLDS